MKNTLRSLGKTIRIEVDGEPMSEPEIMTAIENGRVAFSKNFTKLEAEAFAARIRTGTPPKSNAPKE